MIIGIKRINKMIEGRVSGDEVLLLFEVKSEKENKPFKEKGKSVPWRSIAITNS